MQNDAFQISVNETYEFNLDAAGLSELDIIRISDDQFHLIKQGESYRVTVISYDEDSKTALLKINGSEYRVKIADHYDLLVKKMGLSVGQAHKVSEIKAPMPGLVLSLMVEPGQEVEAGTPLLILEAMKMENVIKSPGTGKIKRIDVEKGKAVDKGEILIELE